MGSLIFLKNTQFSGGLGLETGLSP